MVTFGFYNSLNGDRKYNAEQMSSIFNGIINDGVFMSIGDHLNVTAGEGMSVIVGSGRAWFDSTWTYNDAPLPLEIDPSDPVLDRIDLVVLEVNKEEAVRSNSIKIVKGIPSTSPTAKALLKTEFVTQYALAQVSIPNGRYQLTQADLTNKVGTTGTPYITGILQTINIDTLIAQWQSQWTQWFTQADDDLEDMFTDFDARMDLFYNTMSNEFNTWFDGIQDIFSESDIGQLVTMIQKVSEREFMHYYELVNQETNINRDASGKTISIVTTSDEGSSTTTFPDYDNGKKIVTEVIPAEGLWNYTKTTIIADVATGKKVTESYVRVSKGGTT